jgi:hypothetical protein
MARLTDTRVAALRPRTDGQAEYPDDLVVGLLLRIGSGGRKSWIVRTRAGPKMLNKTLGSYPTLGVGKAREQARKFLEDLATTGTPPVNRTFGQLAKDWLDKVAKPNNRSWMALPLPPTPGAVAFRPSPGRGRSRASLLPRSSCRCG